MIVETWQQYCSWRRSKCPKRRLSENFPGSELLEPETRSWSVAKDRAEDLNQATLEFIGEVGELGQLLLANGIVHRKLDAASRLLDECGDVFFCGCWLLDAWDANCLIKEDLGVFDGGPELEDPRAEDIYWTVAEMTATAAILANAAKKQRYQLRPQNSITQQVSIMAVLAIAANILHAAHYTVVEALEHNVNKLNARYPHGHVAGGGVR